MSVAIAHLDRKNKKAVLGNNDKESRTNKGYMAQQPRGEEKALLGHPGEPKHLGRKLEGEGDIKDQQGSWKPEFSENLSLRVSCLGTSSSLSTSSATSAPNTLVFEVPREGVGMGFIV